MYTLMVCAVLLVVYITGSILYNSLSRYRKNKTLNKGTVSENIDETVSSIKVGVTEIPISYLKRYDGYKHMRIEVNYSTGCFGVKLNEHEVITTERAVDEVILELLAMKEELSNTGFWRK